ncbi:TPA: arginine--tRNA ligase [Candidatus Uhrbacteria bacterium]|nr:arginine--tRNA ligase [Candidatus Uhrbacteria bacterium]
MYVIQEAKTQMLQAIKQAVGQGFSPALEEIELPPEAALGDLAFPCFTLAGKLKRNPSEIATELAAKIGPKGFIAEVKAVGPYVNITFDTVALGQAILKEIHEMEDEYGTSDVGLDKRIMVEFANLNSHKDVHIGHLRNLFVGQTAVNLLKANGYDVIPVAYINDLGLHVAKSVWCMKTYHPDQAVTPEDRIEFLRDVYVEANKKLEEQPGLASQTSEVFRRLEDQRGEELALWKETRDWSIEYLESVYKELGLTIEHWYFESELIGKTKKIIEDLIAQGIVKESQGAWIVDLTDQDLGVNLLIKSDGTLLYNAKDLGLALKKEEDYHPTRSIYVVDERQSHALEQLFATLTLMGFQKELQHLSYEFVTLEGGAMAARKGNVIRYEELRDALFNEAQHQTQLRHEDWTVKQIDDVAHAVSFAAMRFGMLRQDIRKKIVFNLEESLSFEGFTGPYLLYTYARIQSLLKKAGRKKPKWSATTLNNTYSHQLFLNLAKYPEVLFEAGQRLVPAFLSQYLFDLAKSFSDFYTNVPVLKTEGIELGERLALVRSVGDILRNGLEILGIKVIDEM